MLIGSLDLFTRYGEARAGRRLVAVRPGALPITVVNTSVVAQERKSIPLLDEFVLRAIRLGQIQTNHIASLSGVGDSMVRSSAAGLAAGGHLIYGVVEGNLALTPLGEKTAVELATVEPIQRQFKVCFDRTLWKVADYDPRQLISKAQARDEGMQILPAFKSSKIGDKDVTVTNLNALIRAGNIGNADIDILRVTRLATNTHRYLPVQILVYADPKSYEIEIAVLIDDDLSVDHEYPLISLDVVGKLGLKVSSGSHRVLLADELEVARKASSTAVKAENIVSNRLSHVGSVFGFEHNAWLERALTTTKRRLLLAAPSFDVEIMKHQVLPRIFSLLRAGVEVRLAFAESKERTESDDDLKATLARVVQKYSTTFSIAYDKTLSASSLVFDDAWIETGFGWLHELEPAPMSLRLYEGTVVQSRRYADQTYQQLNEQYFMP